MARVRGVYSFGAGRTIPDYEAQERTARDRLKAEIMRDTMNQFNVMNQMSFKQRQQSWAEAVQEKQAERAAAAETLRLEERGEDMRLRHEGVERAAGIRKEDLGRKDAALTLAAKIRAEEVARKDALAEGDLMARLRAERTRQLSENQRNLLEKKRLEAALDIQKMTKQGQLDAQTERNARAKAERDALLRRPGIPIEPDVLKELDLPEGYQPKTVKEAREIRDYGLTQYEGKRAELGTVRELVRGMFAEEIDKFDDQYAEWSPDDQKNLEAKIKSFYAAPDMADQGPLLLKALEEFRAIGQAKLLKEGALMTSPQYGTSRGLSPQEKGAGEVPMVPEWAERMLGPGSDWDWDYVKGQMPFTEEPRVTPERARRERASHGSMWRNIQKALEGYGGGE